MVIFRPGGKNFREGTLTAGRVKTHHRRWISKGDDKYVLMGFISSGQPCISAGQTGGKVPGDQARKKNVQFVAPAAEFFPKRQGTVSSPPRPASPPAILKTNSPGQQARDVDDARILAK